MSPRPPNRSRGVAATGSGSAPHVANHVLFKLVEHETRDRRRGDATDVSLDLAPTLLDAWVLMGAEDRRDAERRGRPDAPHGGRVGRCVDVHRGFDGVTL